MIKKREKMSKHNKIIIIVTVLIIIFSALSLMNGRTPTSIERMFRDTVATIEYYVIKKPISAIQDVFYEYTHLKDVFEENAILKEKLDNYAREAALNEVLSEEINNLKEITSIDYLPTDYNVKVTSIISRDVEHWSDEVTIDLGESSGLTKGMAVISSKGMIGTVKEVGALTSTVSLLSSENPQISLPVMIMSGGEQYYGLLTQYHLEENAYRIQMLSDAEVLADNATVVTSGLGGKGKCPKGILVGTVKSFTARNDTTESICYVTPSADFNSLDYVSVVQRVN